MTVEEVLASRTISGPLTLLMCSPIGDGAAGIIVRLGGAARDSRRCRAGAVPALLSGRDRRRSGQGAVWRAAREAYGLAGVGPDDVDVVEIHDAAAPGELIVSEELGIVRAGKGAELLAPAPPRSAGGFRSTPAVGC